MSVLGNGYPLLSVPSQQSVQGLSPVSCLRQEGKVIESLDLECLVDVGGF